jgi:hypothetical protein
MQGVITYVEARVGDACGVQLRQHTFKGRYSRKVRKEPAMLPMCDTLIELSSQYSHTTD